VAAVLVFFKASLSRNLIAPQQIWALDFRVGSCVTSIAGPHGGAQMYERWRRALRGRSSGTGLKPLQAAVVKSDGGDRCS